MAGRDRRSSQLVENIILTPVGARPANSFSYLSEGEEVNHEDSLSTAPMTPISGIPPSSPSIQESPSTPTTPTAAQETSRLHISPVPLSVRRRATLKTKTSRPSIINLKSRLHNNAEEVTSKKISPDSSPKKTQTVRKRIGGKYGTGERYRRLTKADPNLDIKEIMRPTRLLEKVQAPDVKNLFKFSCEVPILARGFTIPNENKFGTAGSSAPHSPCHNKNENGDEEIDDSTGLVMRWSASFEQPIENFIYPSLQRFDNDAFNARRQMHEYLHGSSAASHTPLQSPLVIGSTKSTAQRSELVKHILSPTSLPPLAADGIRMERASSAAEVPVELEFVNTPKWSWQLLEANNDLPLGHPLRTKTARDATFSAKVAALGGDNPDFEEGTPSPHRVSTAELRKGAKDNTSLLQNSTNSQDESRILCTASTARYEAPVDLQQAIDELECVGETVLRDDLRRSYTRKKFDDAAAAAVMVANSKALGDKDPDYLVKAFTKRQSENSTVISPRRLQKDSDTAVEDSYHLYHNLQARALSQQSNRQVDRLTERTPQQAAYDKHIQMLKSVTPADENHLLGGVLYYRVQKDVASIEAADRKRAEEAKMAFSAKQIMSSAMSNGSFGIGIDSRGSGGGFRGGQSWRSLNSANLELITLRGEDPTLLTASGVGALPPLHTVQLPRLKRAREAMLNGYDVMLRDQALNVQTAMIRQNSMDLTALKESLSQSSLSDIAEESRTAEDLLLLGQLDAGILPQAFVRHDLIFENTDGSEEGNIAGVVVDISQFGIGDTRGVCLGTALAAIERLHTLNLRGNRLSAASIPTIMSFLSAKNLRFLDLSYNDCRGDAIRSVSKFFLSPGVALQHIDLSYSQIRCADIKMLTEQLQKQKNFVHTLSLVSNRIGNAGVAAICHYLATPSGNCHLHTLDLSWNDIGAPGGMELARALRENSTLTRVNISANALGDEGGQYLVDALADHSLLTDLSLAQNSISDKTCFVAAMVLPNHPSMQRLDLSQNPLGEAGARSIFRAIMRNLRCFVSMRSCSYGERSSVLNFTYPSDKYTLDLSEPYSRAVFLEILRKYASDSVHCRFSSIGYKENAKTPEASLSFTLVDRNTISPLSQSTMESLRINPKRDRDTLPDCYRCIAGDTSTMRTGINNLVVTLKGNSEPYIPPRNGVVKFSFVEDIFLPTPDCRIADAAFSTLLIIVELGPTDRDKRQWLRLLSADNFFITSQCEAMIMRYRNNHVLGPGGLAILDIFSSFWRGLLDTENIFDLLVSYTTVAERRELIRMLTIKSYRFNWVNPSGSWSLQLEDKVQRTIFLQIAAINHSESEYGRTLAARGDTSQKGTYYNFRNERFTTRETGTREITIDKAFISNLPAFGTLEFDYVSTSRPPIEAVQAYYTRMAEEERIAHEATVNKARAKAKLQLGTTPPVTGRSNDDPPTSTRSDISDEGLEDIDEFNAEPTLTVKKLQRRVKRLTVTAQTFAGKSFLSTRQARVITDDEFYAFLEHIGLSTRTKVPAGASMFILMDLQLASTKYYFRSSQVLTILDAFEDHWEVQSKLIVVMFARIFDLHNMDIILRNLSSRTQQEVMRRLGVLNVINPLKISFDYVFCLKYVDNRILLITLMELASIECADNILEDPTTELPIATLYGSYTRALNDVRPETMKFLYCDFGVRTKNVSWPTRRELLKKFLVGTAPIDDDIYTTIQQYKEMETAGALATGPIDLQYASYQKALAKAAASQTTKTTKAIISAMRNVISLNRRPTLLKNTSS